MSTLAKPPVVDRAAWDAALAEVTAQEAELFQQVLKIAAARRRLPMTEVTTDYRLTGAEGEVSMAEAFAGQRQLVVYHFMFAPEWEKGCPHCTMYARDLGPGINDEIAQRDTRFVLISRAPYEKLAAWAQENAIATPWYSAPRAFSEEMGVINDSFGDYPGVSVFFRDDEDRVYRTYFTTDAAVEATMPTSGMLRMTPYGMQEKGEDSPEGWPQPNEPLM